MANYADVNEVGLVGNLTKDVELRQGTNTAVAKFTVACNRGKDEKGNDKGADFINVVAFGKQAEYIERTFGKGSRVAIWGNIQTGSYKDKEGRTVYTTEIKLSRIEAIARGESKQENKQDVPQGFAALEESIPF